MSTTPLSAKAKQLQRTKKDTQFQKKTSSRVVRIDNQLKPILNPTKTSLVFFWSLATLFTFMSFPPFKAESSDFANLLFYPSPKGAPLPKIAAAQYSRAAKIFCIFAEICRLDLDSKCKVCLAAAALGFIHHAFSWPLKSFC